MKYAKDGMVAVSVSVDELSEPDTKDKVLEFLTKVGATFTNVILDEPPEFWQKQLHFDIVPCVFVFNREGKWTQFKDEVNYEDIEKLVVELLKKK
jgi:hypothetical protein